MLALQDLPPSGEGDQAVDSDAVQRDAGARDLATLSLAELDAAPGPAPNRPATVGGLGASPATETRPRQLRPARTTPFSGSSQRRLAGLNLVTAVVMVIAGIGTATGVSGLQAPAAVGRWVGAGLGFGSGDGTMTKRPTVAELLPYGKGMWIWEPDKTEGGDVVAIVSRARAVGLTHLYVRTGSTWDGFNNGPFLDKLLPAAHGAGLLVYGWDFPRLLSPADDVIRATQAITHRSPGKQHIDGFAADIETRSEGTAISGQAATEYGRALREAVGPGFPLIATVPRPSPAQNYPYADVLASFDAVAPMVYWLNRQPDTDVAGAIRDLAPYGKPVFPVGQAYDGRSEGGRPGVPPPEELWRFMRFAQANGARGASFWSWQAANQKAWDAIAEAEEFRIPVRT